MGSLLLASSWLGQQTPSQLFRTGSGSPSARQFAPGSRGKIEEPSACYRRPGCAMCMNLLEISYRSQASEVRSKDFGGCISRRLQAYSGGLGSSMEAAKKRNSGMLIAHSPNGETEAEGPAQSSSDGEPVAIKLSKGKTAEIILGASITIMLGVANRILYKMALVPLRQYPFFLAQLTTFGYVVVYFLILFARRQSGIVTPEMLSIPKGRFVAMGALEALGLATGMASATFLPGTMITILSQTFMAWQLLFSSVLLKKRYSLQQLLGCGLVITGVVLAILLSGPSQGTLSLANVNPIWPAVLVLSGAFPACSSIIKEGVFLDAAKRLKGGSLDIFVVNSFGSAFQALFVFLLLPVLSRVGLQIPFSELPAYFQEGAACMLNMGAQTTSCEGAPVLPLVYITANLLFNISILSLLKKSSAVVVSLSISAAVPLTIAAFTLPLPLLGQPQRMGWGFVAGACVLVLGLFVYNSSNLFLKFIEKTKKE